jgi:hypothetical protein
LVSKLINHIVMIVHSYDTVLVRIEKFITYDSMTDYQLFNKTSIVLIYTLHIKKLDIDKSQKRELIMKLFKHHITQLYSVQLSDEFMTKCYPNETKHEVKNAYIDKIFIRLSGVLEQIGYTSDQCADYVIELLDKIS